MCMKVRRNLLETSSSFIRISNIFNPFSRRCMSGPILRCEPTRWPGTQTNMATELSARAVATQVRVEVKREVQAYCRRPESINLWINSTTVSRR